jgi:hypothetical protein
MSIDFGSVFSQAGISLEQQAQQQFGAAVDQYTNDSLRNLAQTYTGSSDGVVPIAYGPDWNGTNYASDLINYQPKHRFLFKVLFDVDPRIHLIENTGKNNFEYVIRQIDQPTTSFDFEEVNFYNFRTKVLKRINHEALSMTMIDDIQNTFHDFYRNYMMNYSPMSRTYQKGMTSRDFERNGFNFNDDIKSYKPDSAGRGILPEGIINPLRSIRIQHFFSHGMKMNEYVFVNPRIIDVNFDEVNHEGGDNGLHCTVRFDYDALYMEPTIYVQGSPEERVNGTDMYIGTGGSESPFLGAVGGMVGGITSGIIGSVSQQAISGMMSKVVNSIPMSSNPVLGNMTRNLGGSISNVVGSIGRNTIYGMTKPINPNISVNPIIFDNYE